MALSRAARPWVWARPCRRPGQIKTQDGLGRLDADQIGEAGEGRHIAAAQHQRRGELADGEAPLVEGGRAQRFHRADLEPGLAGEPVEPEFCIGLEGRGEGFDRQDIGLAAAGGASTSCGQPGMVATAWFQALTVRRQRSSGLS